MASFSDYDDDEKYNSPQGLEDVVDETNYEFQTNLPASDRQVKLDLEKHSSYLYVRKLGGGAQVDVFLVKRGDEYFAVKAYSYKLTSTNIEVGKRDEDLLDLYCICKFNHPYIVSKRDFFVGDKHFFVVLDYAQCNLDQYLQHMSSDNSEVELSFRSKCTIMHRIGSALEFLCRIGYVHNDVKAVNVLIVNGTPMLTDFGLTRMKEERDYTSQTYYYRAPELLLNGRGIVDRMYKELFDSKKIARWRVNFSRSEIWSYGIFCLGVLYGIPNITHGKEERKMTKALEKVYCKDAYITLFRLMIDNIQKGVKDPMYTAIIAAYGEPPSFEDDDDTFTTLDLLHHICDTLLVLDQDKRVDSIEYFFDSPIFALYRNCCSFPERKSAVPYNPLVKSPKEYDVKDINRVIHLIMSQSQNECCQTFCTLEAVDLFVQRLPVYATTVDELYLFGATCLKVIDMIHNLGHFKLNDCAKMCNTWCSSMSKGHRSEASKYKVKDVSNMLLTILRTEGGPPIIPNTYTMAPCAEVVLDVCTYMQDYSTYMSMTQKGMIRASLERITKRTAKRERCGVIHILPLQ